jgi:hypothetical protein
MRYPKKKQDKEKKYGLATSSLGTGSASRGNDDKGDEPLFGGV